MNENELEEVQFFLRDLIDEINASNREQTSSKIEISLSNFLGTERYIKIMDNAFKDIVLINQVKDCLDIKLNGFSEEVKTKMANILCDIARAVGHERDYMVSYTSLVSLMSDGKPYTGRLIFQDVCENILGAVE